MQKETTWVLVSDASRAKIYTTTDRGHNLVLDKEFHHSSSRAKAAELVSDQPGRLHQSGRVGAGGMLGKGSRSGTDKSDPKEAAHHNFASILCAILEQGLKDYQKLMLVASPHFLGLIRQKLDDQIAKRVILSVDKDYTSLSTQELQEKLKELL